MRKFLILTILLSCMHIMARGQTITEDDFAGLFNSIQAMNLRYWFDDNSDSQQTSDVLSGNHTLDVNHFTDGLHTLHYQAVGADGLGYDVASHVFLKVANNMIEPAIAAEDPAARLQYWFDGDAANLQVCNGLSGVYNIDVSALSDGLHTLHYQVTGTNGTGYDIASQVFLKAENNMMEPAIAGAVNVAMLEYWFDSDAAGKQSANDLSGIYTLDVSQLLDGIHTLHYQLIGTDGMGYDTSSDVFLKMEGLISDDALLTEQVFAEKVEYWFDGNSAAKQTIEYLSGIQILDVSQLTEGLHTLHYQVVGTNGGYYDIASEVFLKLEEGVANPGIAYMPVAKELKYWFDRDAASAVKVDAEEGLKVIDVSTLQSGLHTVNYQIVYEDGSMSPSVTRLFLKNFEEEQVITPNVITKYQYWLNGNSAAMNTIELPAPVSPYTLISLLPLQMEPLRSSSFAFEVTNSTPTIYAKNELNVRFHDARGYFIDGDKSFIDYSVNQEVEPVGELQATQTFPKVAENDIRWYTMQAAPGDTAAFRLSQAATLQVFAPSGEEVFKTSESASVQWGGIHTWEEGTYYVAVHDVTGSQYNMTLDYMHMDKYDVVNWDVHNVGNGGCSTITFKGNGFRDLYGVDLYTAEGDTIHSVVISYESDAETAVTFDFTDAELGVYDAVFHFTQEDKHFVNIVTVEEAVDIELATNVSFPSSFLRGTSTTYTIKITNLGNMTAYQVPLEIMLRVKSIENISEIRFDSDLKSMSMPELSDSIDIEELDILKEIINDANDLCQFVVYTDSISQQDYGMAQVMVTLPPSSTRQFSVKIKSSSVVDLHAYMTESWFSMSTANTGNLLIFKPRKADRISKFCCVKERWQCAADAIAYVAGFFGGNANCAGATLSAAFNTATDVWCSEGSDISERFNNYVKSHGASLANRLINTLVNCIIGYYKPIVESLRESRRIAFAIGNVTEVNRISEQIRRVQALMYNDLARIYKGVNTAISGGGCIQAWTQTKPNCPPNPGGGGGPSNPVPPSDPNDIYGYLSEAGSKFMTDTVAKVNYTIEFENDTAFAQASAHTIVIRDTLDSRYFDLASFLPTSVKIGERETFLDETEDVKTTGGVTSFIKTIDMRPEINAIAQVEGEYSQQTGIAKWTFTSLDPMTMEATDDLMQGILPVNYNGTSGIGEVMFEVGVKPNKADGTQIPNRAGIVFDYEASILTPTWVNIVDATAPDSHVADVRMLNDSTATVRIEATDELSGPWRYNVYVQYGSGAWFLGAENVPADTTASVKVYEGIDHGFYVVVTDSAGNVEAKEAVREFSFEVFAPQVDTSTKLQLAQGWNWVSHNQQEALSAEALKPGARRIVSLTDELYKDDRFGWTGTLSELLPTELYKVQMAEGAEVQLSGRLFNAAFRNIPLYAGWNWIGYPVAHTMTPAEALQKMEAEEGDFIVGQDGMATFTGGQWTGTLLTMEPGLGYMYRSVSDKSLFLNATAQSSSRMVHRSRFMVPGSEMPEGWTVNKRKYPNVMGMVCDLYQEGTLTDHDEWLVGAFCGDECRGLSQTVGGHLMMNIYGQGGEEIVFLALHRGSGEVVDVIEVESFRSDVLGTLQQPYELHSGVPTGIAQLEGGKLAGEDYVYDLQGRRVKKSSLFNSQSSMQSKGVYIMTDGKKSRTRKVVRK